MAAFQPGGAAFLHFALHFLRFVAFRSRRGARAPKVHPSTTHHLTGSHKMITFFFAFVMVTTFVAVAAGVAESVLSTRSFA